MTGEVPVAQVWVDADACPGPVKEILFRAAERAQVQVRDVAYVDESEPARDRRNFSTQDVVDDPQRRGIGRSGRRPDVDGWFDRGELVLVVVRSD